MMRAGTTFQLYAGATVASCSACSEEASPVALTRRHNASCMYTYVYVRRVRRSRIHTRLRLFFFFMRSLMISLTDVTASTGYRSDRVWRRRRTIRRTVTILSGLLSGRPGRSLAMPWCTETRFSMKDSEMLE